MTAELREKARAVSCVIMDVDGVLTDGRALYVGDRKGVFFNVHDGAAIKYLGRAGLKTAIISGRDTAAVQRRAEELGIDEVIQGAKVKLEAYNRIKERLDLEDAAACYVADDLTDLPVLRRVGLAVAVPNARPEVRRAAHMITGTPGGDGAVRELAEFILKAQGKWRQIMARYVEEDPAETA